MRILINFETAISEWHLAVHGSRQIAIADIFRDVLISTPNDGAHRARDILKTSFSIIRSHLSGTARSGVQLLRKRLYYGTDQLLDRFTDAVLFNSEMHGMSVEDGLEVTKLQYEVINSVLNENSRSK